MLAEREAQRGHVAKWGQEGCPARQRNVVNAEQRDRAVSRDREGRRVRLAHPVGRGQQGHAARWDHQVQLARHALTVPLSRGYDCQVWVG